MAGSRTHFLKPCTPQFKRKGCPTIGNKRTFGYDESSEIFHSVETVYRILCQSKKIGSVIGRGGTIVKSLREETQAKISVSDSISGSDERVITISSPSDKEANRQSSDYKAMSGDVSMEPHCAAQDALQKVHDRIVEEDILGAENGTKEEVTVTARLLVANNMVGCVLGKRGDVIQRLRSETGANIRVLPADNLPACVMSNDELVHISGKPRIVKKALFEVSTLLHQNPRKDKPLNFPTPYSSQGLHPSGPPLRKHFPSANSPWLERSMGAPGLPPPPWEGGHGILPYALRPDDFDDIAPLHDSESPSEFMMKILCSAEKIGGVIGKGGANVRNLERETGARIYVEDISSDSNERVIRVSSLEVLDDRRSQTIDAILQLQNKTSEYSEKGIVTARLLVASNKVGCILGEGGHVINEMRRRTNADIRVFSKKDKPKCASADEELVQISGSPGIFKDALTEIALRLRTRCLRDAGDRGESAPIRPIREFGAAENLHGGVPPYDVLRAQRSGRHDQGDFHEYDSPSFPVTPRGPSYFDVHEARISSISERGSHISEVAGIRGRLHDRYSSGSDFGTLDRFNAPRDMYHSPVSSALCDTYRQPGVHQSYNSQYDAYPNVDISEVPYQKSISQTVPHQAMYTPPGSHQNPRGHYPYPY